MIETEKSLDNPKFLALLDKHHLKHDTPPEAIIEVATRILCLNPTDTEWYLLSFGDVPETFEEYDSIINFVKNTQSTNPYSGLQETLTKLHKLGKSIYPKGE